MPDILIKQGIILILLTSGLPLVVSSFCSAIVAVLQTATQVQEQTLTFLVRFSAVAAVLFFCAPWFLNEYVSFFQETLASLQYFGIRK